MSCLTVTWRNSFSSSFNARIIRSLGKREEEHIHKWTICAVGKEFKLSLFILTAHGSFLESHKVGFKFPIENLTGCACSSFLRRCLKDTRNRLSFTYTYAPWMSFKPHSVATVTDKEALVLARGYNSKLPLEHTWTPSNSGNRASGSMGWPRAVEVSMSNARFLTTKSGLAWLCTIWVSVYTIRSVHCWNDSKKLYILPFISQFRVRLRLAASL